MKKIALLIMIAIVSLSSCTNEELTDSALNETESKKEYKPVVFGTYIENTVSSRAVNYLTTSLSITYASSLYLRSSLINSSINDEY